MRAAESGGSLWTAPTHSPGSLPARSAAIPSRSATWVEDSAHSTIRAMHRHHNSYFKQEGDCARRSAIHRQSPVLIVVDARVAGSPACAAGCPGDPDPLQSAWTNPGDRDVVA